MSTSAAAVRGGLLLLAAAAGLNRAEARDFFIHDGDRVVFLGDSITQQLLYTNYIESYTLCRHPSWNLTFRNVGWGGDTSWLRQRKHIDETLLSASDDESQLKMVTTPIEYGLDRDVFPLKPTVVTIDFGMNDFGYQAFRPDIFRAYITSERLLERTLKAHGATPILLTTQPIEEKAADPGQDVRNLALARFADGLRDLARSEKVDFVDQFNPYLDALVRSHNFTVGNGLDAVHPGPAGHTIMAWAILKGLGATALVSTASINAGSKAVDAAQACSITGLKVDGSTVSFDRIDDALPMPIDPKAEPVLELVPITHDLNDYMLKVSGLPAGRYDVSIDGEPAATVSSEELAGGWNLAYRAGPITKQADEVLRLVAKKNNLYYDRWRNVQLYEQPKWAGTASDFEAHKGAELARLDGEIASLESRINAERRPKTRHFVISPSAEAAD
ncbi:MAG TPA: SGNH/GDSL hydrolase family protein [Opitutaceae bacterium]|jgi:lysophospholipase L1-like esterase